MVDRCSNICEATMTTGGTQSNWKDHVLTTIIFYTKIIKIIKNFVVAYKKQSLLG